MFDVLKTVKLKRRPHYVTSFKDETYLICRKGFTGLDDVVSTALGKELLELLMAINDVTIELYQVRGLLAESFFGGRKLQDLGNVAQISTLQFVNRKVISFLIALNNTFALN